MTAYYHNIFEVSAQGSALDLPTGNDVQTVGYFPRAVRIVDVFAFVAEEIKCATTQAVVDIGTSSDPDAFVDGYEPSDNAAIDTYDVVPSAKIVERSIPAGTTVIAKVVTAGAEGGSETGQLVVILRVVPDSE